MSHTNGGNGVKVNGVGHTALNGIANDHEGFPIAICGIGLRLPGGLESPQQMWEFLLAKGDARGRVPESRYNVSAYYSPSGEQGTVASEYGYFLENNVGSLDVSRFSLSKADLEATDPQQRLMLEVARECVDDAGEVSFRGRPIGCFMGSFGEEFLDMQNKDPLQAGTNKPEGHGEFMLSNRVGYEMDLRGPWYVCSAPNHPLPFPQ
jgi:acyl transferase domain-containing protein